MKKQSHQSEQAIEEVELESVSEKIPLQTPPARSNTILIVLLIAVSFFTGYLFFKVQSLEKNTNTVAAAAGTNQPAPQQPAQDLKAMPPLKDTDHIRGNKDAAAVLVEYSDLECPFCKAFHPTMQQVMKDYGNKVAWVYRHYPLPFHQNAQKEAEASECANELGGNEAFWNYTDKIFERTTSNGTGFALDALVPLASEIGLDENKFKTCLDSGKYANQVKDDEAGGAKAGINGTPGTIIVGRNGKREFIPGALPYDQVKPLIDKVLN